MALWVRRASAAGATSAAGAAGAPSLGGAVGAMAAVGIEILAGLVSEPAQVYHLTVVFLVLDFV